MRMMMIIGVGVAFCALYQGIGRSEIWMKTGELSGASDVHTLMQAADGTIYAGCAVGSDDAIGGIFKTTNGGMSWDSTGDFPDTHYIGCLLQAADGSIFAGAYGRTVGVAYKTMNGGAAWTATGDFSWSQEVTSLLYASDESIYAGLFVGITLGPDEVFKTTNGGGDWTGLVDFDKSWGVNTLLQALDGTIYAGVSYLGVFKSINGGTSWQPTGEISEPFIVRSLLQASDGSIYAGGKGIYKTTNNGASWKSAGNLSDVWIDSIVQVSDGSIYAGGEKDSETDKIAIVLKTTDGGDHWEDTGELSGAREVYSLLGGPDGIVYAGTGEDGGVFKLGEPSTPTPTPTPLLDVRPSSNALAVGEPFTIDLTVQPVGRAFDAWGVIMGKGIVYSFILGKPTALYNGLIPLAQNMTGLSTPYSGMLLSVPAIPAGVAGAYDVIVGFVPPGTRPSGVGSCIEGYVEQEQITIRP